MSTPLRNAPVAVFIGAILMYGGAFAWYMLAHYDLVTLLRDVNGDDSFYYFQIARNLAEGKFSTFDGGITRTNGYHPIWMLLITPFYWIFDAETALFAIKAFEIMLVAGGAACIVLAARIARLPWILLFALPPFLYRLGNGVFFGGMESAAALFMLGLLFLTLTLFARSPARGTWLLAAAAFALPWVRLEFAAVSVATTAMLCLVEWSGPRDRSPRAPSALRACIPLLGACAGILAYFVYNRLVFGGAVPVSGAIRQVWSQDRWERDGGYNLAENFQAVLQIHAFDTELAAALGLCVCVLLVLWSTRRVRGRDDRLLLIFLAGVFGLAAGHLAKFAQTVLMVHPYWGGYTRYFVPAYLMEALIVPVACYVALHLVRRFVEPRLGRTASVPRVSIVTAGAVALLIQADFAGPFRTVDRKSEFSLREWEITSYLGTQVMNRLLPEGSVIGSFDSGVIGYFSRFPVVNLDGVVNSYDYMRARREGTEVAFRQRFGITHFASAFNPNHRPDTILFEGPPFSDSNRAMAFKLWPRPPEVSLGEFDSYFWEKMTPHFDYESESVAVVVDGNMAQAFFKDYEAAATRDETLVFSWSTGEGERSRLWRPWETMDENDDRRILSSVFELPNDAGRPVRITTAPAGRAHRGNPLPGSDGGPRP